MCKLVNVLPHIVGKLIFRVFFLNSCVDKYSKDVLGNNDWHFIHI